MTQKRKLLRISWKGIEDLNEARGQANGSGWVHSRGYYAQTAAAALASEYNVTHSENTWKALEWLRIAGPPILISGVFRVSPNTGSCPLRKPVQQGPRRVCPAL